MQLHGVCNDASKDGENGLRYHEVVIHETFQVTWGALLCVWAFFREFVSS